jgi:hypothetical protein
MKQWEIGTDLTIPLKLGLGRFVSLHICCIPFGKIRHRRINTSQCHNQLPKYEIHTTVCLGKNDRCAEIAFSGHQNAENQHNETFEK